MSMWRALVNGLLQRKSVVEAMSPGKEEEDDKLVAEATPEGYIADDESVESEQEEEDSETGSPKPFAVHKNERPMLSPEAQRKFYWKYRPDANASKADDGGGFRDRKMPMVTIHSDLYWGRSTLNGCGNGVFTHVARKKGDIVEIGPTILDMDTQWRPKAKTAVHEFYTLEYNPTLNHWRKNCRDQKPRTKYSVLMLGYGSLYNHSDNPNCDVEFGACQTFLMKALRDIEADEELFIDYGTDYWADMAAPVKVADEVAKKEEAPPALAPASTPAKKTKMTKTTKTKRSPHGKSLRASSLDSKRRKVG